MEISPAGSNEELYGPVSKRIILIKDEGGEINAEIY